MVFASYLFNLRLENKHLEEDAADMAVYIDSKLASGLRELETTLGVVSETMRGMLLQGATLDDMKRYLAEMTDYGRETKNLTGFVSFFAMFDVFGGVGFNGTGWEGTPGYVPEERPWYKAAATAGGEIVVTEPYRDVIEQGIAVTYVRNIYGSDGNRLAIICLDVLLDKVHKFFSDNRGHFDINWMLFDRNLTIIAHKNPELLGIPLRDAPGGLAEIAAGLEQGRPVSGHRVISDRGQKKFVTVHRLENGWYLCVATVIDSYKQNLSRIQWFLILLGLIMASGLSVVLMRIVRERNSADKRAEKLLESTDTLIIITEIETDNIIYVNEKMKKAFGFSDDVIGQKCWKLLVDGGTARCGFCPKNDPDIGSDTPISWEFFSPVNGRHYRIVSRFIDWPGGSRVFLEVCDDITEMKNTAAKIREADEETRVAIAERNKALEEKKALVNLGNILNGLDVMIYVTDPDTGEILFMNDGMKQHYGIEGDCVGQKCYKILQSGLDDRCDFCPCFKLDEDPNTAIVWEERSTLTDRTYRNVDRYIDWPGRDKVHIQHSVDLTELVAAKESAEQSSRYKSAFLANMSHEIRTPMNAILGIAEIQLRDKKLTADAEEAFGKIYESGDLLINIINDILDLSKIEAGKLELSPVKYDIPSLINDTAQLNRLRYDSKPIQFNVQVDENTPLELFGDELRIKQVLNNVLSNAFKYTDEGSIDFAVACEPGPEVETRDGGVTLIFRVTDTGQGMTDTQLDTLFDEYTRFNAGANRTTIGAGLGMSITMRLVQMMHGTISVESEPGKGTVFIVRLPQKRAGTEVCGAGLAEKLRNFRFQSASIMKRTQFLREYMPYGCVLVVDDVESNVYVAKGMLSPYGLTVDTASSGLEAVNKIKRGNEYDIVFMDHMMPKMDGIEATRIIREMGYKRSIIALTANALIGREEMFLRNGFDGFIPKPLDSRELNLHLNEFIRNRKPTEVVEAARREQRKNDWKEAVAGVQGGAKRNELKTLVIRDAENTLKTLEELCAQRGSPHDDDVEPYITAVHGIKSALANVGETELSAMALRLELAGKARDFTIISNETHAFMDAVRALIEKLKPAEGADGEEISGEDLAHLREKLEVIKAACADLDIDAASAVLNALKQKTWPAGVVGALDEIAGHLLHSAFDEVAAAAEKALTV